MTVHSALGNGFQEVIYQRALEIEMKDRNLGLVGSMKWPILKKGATFINVMYVRKTKLHKSGITFMEIPLLEFCWTVVK